MTEAERKAMEWLNDLGDGSPLSAITHHVSTLKAMLARPVLPEEPSEEALKAIWNGERTPGPIYRRLYAHLAAPKTKEVDVECWGVLTEGGVAGSYFDERSARNDTMVKEGAGHVVRLTGKATVPA